MRCSHHLTVDVVQIYLQTIVGVSLRCNVLGPFLSFVGIMASLLCGLARYSLNLSHWTDIVAGYVVGIVFAVYVVSPTAISITTSRIVIVNSNTKVP